jgi:phosphoserine phosphatase
VAFVVVRYGHGRTPERGAMNPGHFFVAAPPSASHQLQHQRQLVPVDTHTVANMASAAAPARIVATLFYNAAGSDNSDDARGITSSRLNAFYTALGSALPGLETERISSKELDPGAACRVVEVAFPLPSTSPTALETLRRHETIAQFEREANVECVFQADIVHRRYKRLAVFDMDSTLIQQEVIDEIASMIGVEKEVSAITAAAMNGELDFEASLRARCKLLNGVPSTVFETIKSRITLNAGVKELIPALQRLGFKTAVLSGGFTPLTGWMGQRLGLDYAYANHLVVSEDGQTLTGELTGEIVHAQKKRQHVLEIAKKEGILLDQVVCVGDGANDLPMMGVAGLGVAFHAKPKVQLQAPARLNSESMLDLLYLLGLTSAEQQELLC